MVYQLILLFSYNMLKALADPGPGDLSLSPGLPCYMRNKLMLAHHNGKSMFSKFFCALATTRDKQGK